MFAIYNDIEKYAEKLLTLRINDEWLPRGRVSTEDIRDLCETDLSKYSHCHLFAGIGGFPLAARMAGLPDDFKFFTAGFPCQPFSNAGQRAGTQDHRYLWPETLAALTSHGPDVAILENVAGLASMAFPKLPSLVGFIAYSRFIQDHFYKKRELGVLNRICDDVEQAGYTVQPIIVPACAVDAKHRRDRIWIVCFRNGFMANAEGLGCGERRKTGHVFKTYGRQDGQLRGVTCCAGQQSENASETLADTQGQLRRPGQERRGARLEQVIGDGGGDVSNPDGQRRRSGNTGGKYAENAWQRSARQGLNSRPMAGWRAEPAICRVVAGLPGRVDRVKGLGNSIVPQVAAEIIRLAMVALDVRPEFAPGFEQEWEI